MKPKISTFFTKIQLSGSHENSKLYSQLWYAGLNATSNGYTTYTAVTFMKYGFAYSDLQVVATTRMSYEHIIKTRISQWC